MGGGPQPNPGGLAPVIDDLSIFLAAGRIKDPSVALSQGEQAERLGLRRVWLSERYDLKEAGAMLGGVAARTSRLGVGTAVVATGSRHPLMTAALGATMQAMYGGRFVLGLGRSAAVYLRGQSMREATYAAFADYIDIVRRLWRGEVVSYDGPAGSFEQLKTVDPIPGEPPPIWSVIVGGPKGCRTAARVADGVMLQPFGTPDATRKAVTWIREERQRLGLDPNIHICQPVVAAPEMDTEQTVALTKARLVTYVQMKVWSDPYVLYNGWDNRVMQAVRDHPRFADLERANADQVFHRSELMAPAQLIPDEWIEESSAVGSIDQCVRTLRRFKDAGADEIALYGSNPADNEKLIAAWRAHRAAEDLAP
ncbi:MAG TPA: TIGR03857 family LLM class F420-dependent oxidoreductase [Pseudonocardia sp.]|jgi:probable F420-dependent oxidoreductase